MKQFSKFLAKIKKNKKKSDLKKMCKGTIGVTLYVLSSIGQTVGKFAVLSMTRVTGHL